MDNKKDTQSSDKNKPNHYEVPLHLSKEALDRLIQEKIKRAEYYRKRIVAN